MTSSSQTHRVDDAQPEDDSAHHHHHYHHHRDPSTETDVELDTPKITKAKEGGSGDSRAWFIGKARRMSQKTKTKPLDRTEDVGAANDEKNMSKRLLSATSAALLRVKDVAIRSGSSGQVLHPRSVTVVRSLSPASSSSRTRGGDETRSSPPSSLQISSPPDHGRAETSEERSQERSISSCSGITSARDGTPTSTEGVVRGGDKNKLSELFGDDNNGETTTDDAKSKGSRIFTNDDKGHAVTPRARWASTLMTTTLAREKATKATGKPALGIGIGLLPRPQDAGDKVKYCHRL